MSGSEVPVAPEGLRDSGRRLWASVVAVHELQEHEEALLREACRTVDDLDALAAAVAENGAVQRTTAGTKVSPALTEARQLRLALARLLASLRVPDEDDQRPQRRGAARGTYDRARA